MLKIHSFLRKIKSAVKNFFKKMLRRYSKHMAATAYAVSAALLVFYFGDFDQLIYASANEATYEESDGGVEETKQYTLFNPYNNILQHKATFLNHPEILQAAFESAEENIEETENNKEEYVELFSIGEKVLENEPIKGTVVAASVDLPVNLTFAYNSAMKLTLNETELEVLCRIVEAEATGEDVYGKILVANVVLNRVLANEFPDTVSEVVFQRVGKAVQFSPTKDGRYWTVSITESTREAVERALDGEDYSEGALYFFARKLTTAKKAQWFDTSLKKVVQYGCHEFYANK